MASGRRQGLSTNEILDHLFNKPLPVATDIFIEPPDDAIFTDEDSGNEEEVGIQNVHHLTGNQLHAPAEMRVRGNHATEANDDDDIDQKIDEPIGNGKKSNKKNQKPKITWEKKDLMLATNIFPGSNYSKYRDLSPVGLFELFYDDKIIEHAMKETTKYGLTKNYPPINITSNEMKVFIAILIVSGYNAVPRRHMYWSHSKDTYNEAIATAMRRGRFDNIMRCLHFNAKATIDKTDKYAKLRPLLQHLQKKFMLHYVPTPSISHDEAMIEYFGKHSCKQTIRNKPIRFGYKVWCQNTIEGYLVAFEPYQGKSHCGSEELETEFGKCPATVLHLLNTYTDDKKHLPYHLYFDNLFTSVPLLRQLKHLGYEGTGTIRANRLDSLCPITSAKCFEKKPRGYSETVTGNTDDKNVKITRWKDNSVVTVASTVYGEVPVSKVRRWSKEKLKHIDVPIPKAVSNYNKNMGGTDQMHQNINAYRIGIRGKKWWWSIFTWTIDVAVQNAWILARGVGCSVDQLAFRREIAMSYLKRFQSLPLTRGMRPRQFSGADDARYDNAGHFARPTAESKRRKCAAESCKSQTRVECSKCDVGLCIACFAGYHIK